MARRCMVLLVLALPLLVLAPGFSSFYYPASSAYSDLTISHLPNLLYLRYSLETWGVIPLWSDAILSGFPFAANPLSGLWYPFTWMLAYLPQPFGYNLVFLIHLLFGGLGVFLLLRIAGKGAWAALAGGISFELMPKLLAHYAAGHITLVFAVCFTPWVLLAEYWRARQPGSIAGVAPGIFLGWIALIDIRWTPYAGLAWLAFFLINEVKHTRQDRLIPGGLLEPVRRWLPSVLRALLQLGVAACISAPVLLPLAQYSALSTRAAMTNADRLAFSLPPARLLGLIFPDIGGYSEWTLYPGVLGMFALLVVLGLPAARRRTRTWFILLLLSIAIALGAYNPLMQFAAHIPGYDALRVPPRSLFLAGLVFSFLTAELVDILSAQVSTDKRLPLPLLFAYCVLAGGLFLGAWRATGVFNLELFWGALFALLFFVAIVVVCAVERRRAIIIPVLLIPLLVLDLGSVSVGGVQLRDPESVFSEGRAVAEWLLAAGGDQPFRVYSPSYSIPQLAAAAVDVELADGVDPLQLAAYAAFMARATGVSGDGYSVTLPAFDTGRPELDNRQATPDPALLGILNVRYVVSAFPLSVSELTPAGQVEGRWVYENQRWRPRAWLQAMTDEFGMVRTPLQNVEWQPNRIRLKAAGPGIAVLSELVYPGWEVRVDGRAAQMIKVGGLLRGVALEAGEHRIEYVFRPLLVYIGVATSLVTWLGLATWALTRRRQLKERANAG